jgi:hypothetical protein
MNEGPTSPSASRLWAEAPPFPEDPALTGLLPTNRIVTIRGERPADEVEAGDIVVVLARAGYGPVQRVYECMVDLARRPDAAPVLIVEGAFDRFSPSRTTVVAPQGLIGIDDWLVPAAALVNGHTVRQLPALGYVRYLQFEMGQHDMLVADGLRVASLRQGSASCRPILAQGAALEALRDRIEARIPALDAAGLLPRDKVR